MGHIGIRDLEVYAYHGVYEEENHLGQKFYVSADLTLNTWDAEHTDHLDDSVNYGIVCECIRETMLSIQNKLIERTAGNLCEKLLETFPMIEGVKIRLDKPNAPIPQHLRTVFVEAERKWTDAYIAVGSNMGNRDEYIRTAIEMLSNVRGIHVEKVSTLIVTEPYGYTDQEPFLNGCLKVRTWLPAEVLLQRMQEIELELHRERKIHWGPRTIDLDILLYGDEVIHTETLSVPHVDMTNRQFVLEPLDEIAGWVWHPVEHKTIHQLFEILKKREEKNYD